MDFEEQFSYLRRKLTMRIQINKSIIFDRFGNIIVLASFAKTNFCALPIGHHPKIVQ